MKKQNKTRKIYPAKKYPGIKKRKSNEKNDTRQKMPDVEKDDVTNEGFDEEEKRHRSTTKAHSTYE